MKIPESESATTFGDWAYLAIIKHYQKILKHEENVLKNTDPEELHQMRVAMRRLRSALTGFQLAINLPPHLKGKTVAKIARVLGNLRDLDVLEENLLNIYLPQVSHQEQHILCEICHKLHKKKQIKFKQVKTILESKLYFDLKEGFNYWLSEPSYQQIAQIPIEFILPDLLTPEISQLLLHPGWFIGVTWDNGEIYLPENLDQSEVKMILHEQGAILHDLRKQAKRSRYNLELFSHFYGEDYGDYVDQIKEIQTVIGEIQDCYVFSLFFSKILGSTWQEELPHLATKFQDIRYQQWQEWEKLQNIFLNPQFRQDFYLTVQTEIGQRPKIRETNNL